MRLNRYLRSLIACLVVCAACFQALPAAAQETVPVEFEPAEPEPVEPIAEETLPPDASARDGDVSVVSGDGITFRLFNYSTDINKDSTKAAWRPISSYFTFRDSAKTAGTDVSVYDIPSPNINAAHDADGFTKYHATVERGLDGNGNPMLDLTRNADGTARTDPGVDASVRSLAYLFSDSGDHAVTAYTPGNTILQKIDTQYLYDSRANAVDYDTSANLFRVRSYAERNSTTAGYGSAYGDFLPFTYTGGLVLGTTGGTEYHVSNTSTDYWFGMTMEVNFFQTKDGILDGEEMVFHFSGDDDVWVFVDDVLVLDLGGTHGTVDGYINFATGEVRQYLSWQGANNSEEAQTTAGATSFPTTIRSCFDAAGKTPNGGWNADGQTFANYTEHTLKFFYLERGGAVANCILDFRLPTLPDKSLTVTKELTADSGEVTDFIQDSLTYRFRVVQTDEKGKPTGELFLAPGTSYDLLENGVKISTEELDENGCFHLKAGQSAQFTEMLKKGGGATSYLVEEIMPDSLTGQYAGVEYLVSGSGGDTRAEEGAIQEFTAYQTGMLSAEETQTVTFRNKVNVSQLGRLKITKELAPGAQFPESQKFQIQVTLGGELLRVGTAYLVGEETRTVSTAGILELEVGETAEILQGILSGTAYAVTELGTDEGGFNAVYSGTVSPSGTVNCAPEGASGEFPLGSTVHVTITNANYDFSLQIPLSKEAIDNNSTVSFHFLVEQVAQEGENWVTVQPLPGTAITVTDASPTAGSIVIGYTNGTEGTFYYRVSEQVGAEPFIYDDTFYILEITVEDGTAAVTGILRNGIEALEPDTTLTFLNRKTTTLTVTKTVSGYDTGEKFPFTATVTLNGEVFQLPESETYTTQGNQIHFSLGQGESITLAHIPIGAVVTVKETEHDGFHVSYLVEGTHAEPQNGNTTDILFETEAQTVHFTNEAGYRLPNTGGAGTTMYIAGGWFCIAISLLLYKPTTKRKKGI